MQMTEEESYNLRQTTQEVHRAGESLSQQLKRPSSAVIIDSPSSDGRRKRGRPR